MKPGALDALTVIPPHEIECYGFPYIRMLADISDEVDAERLEAYLQYFKNTWLRMFKPDDWNIHNCFVSGFEIANRTNNPLESYNNRLNEIFNGPHPNIRVFASTLRTHVEEIVRDYTAVILGRSERRSHRPMIVANHSMIPKDYETFKVGLHSLQQNQNSADSQQQTQAEGGLKSTLVQFGSHEFSFRNARARFE